MVDKLSRDSNVHLFFKRRSELGHEHTQAQEREKQITVKPLPLSSTIKPEPGRLQGHLQTDADGSANYQQSEQGWEEIQRGEATNRPTGEWFFMRVGDGQDSWPPDICRIATSSWQTVFSSPNSYGTKISLKLGQLEFLWSGKYSVWLSSPESERLSSEPLTECKEFEKELIKHIPQDWKMPSLLIIHWLTQDKPWRYR